MNCKLIQKAVKKTHKAYKKTSRIPLASLNYHLGNYKEAIWLVSDGRSGSTWLSDLINADRRYRELFEPFHPYIVKKVRDYSLFQYLRPEDQGSPLCDFLTSVFSGEFKHLRADVSKPRLFYKGLLVKDIFAHLLMPWVHHNIPGVKKVLLIRNPFSVALSKQRLKKWTWMTEPKEFLNQPALYSDYLKPFSEVIQSIGDDFIEKQVLIWAIIHYVPLKNLNSQDLHIIFYEDLVTRPAQEIERLFNYLELSYDQGESLNQRIYKPTRTSKNFSQELSRDSLLDSWKNQLSAQQIDKGMEILEQFQLSKVYEDNLTPSRDALAQGKFALQSF